MNDFLILGPEIGPHLGSNLSGALTHTLALLQDGLPNPGTPAQPAPGGGGGGGGGFGDMFLPLMMVMLTVMILMSILSGRGEKKRRRTMLQGLTKRDRVQTTAGIIGTVVEMKGDEIVLKVDEASNTRIRFAKSAVQQVLRSSGSSATDSSADAGEDAGQQAGHEKETVTS